MPTLKISSCTVQLLDSTEIIIEVDKLHKSSDLLDEVCCQMGIKETGYFGLQYQHPKDDKVSWFDVDKPLQKQIKKASHKFKVAVQFYPPSFQMLQDEVTRYQFVLQIRENLLTGKWSCSLPTQALLASYIIQAEYGDFDDENHDSSYMDSNVTFIEHQDENFMVKVRQFLQKNKGLSPADAEWMYLETARKILLYGMDVFNILDADGNPMILTVNVNGVHIIHMNTILHSFLWPNVSKVHTHGHEVIIDVEYSDQEGNHQELSVSFCCQSTSDQKRIQRTCTKYKDFAYHGKPKTAKARSKSIRLKKSKQESKEVRNCSHTADLPPADFKRVDSKRFSKKVMKTSDKASVSDDHDHTNGGSHPTDVLQPADEENKSENTIGPIPVITETLVSDNEMNVDDIDGQQKDPVTGIDGVVIDEPSDEDGPVEVSVVVTPAENVTDEKDNAAVVLDHVEDDHTVKDNQIEVAPQVVDETKTSNSQEAHHVAEDEDATESTYNVEEDNDVVIIEFEDIEEEISPLETDEKSSSLLDEIDKELNH